MKSLDNTFLIDGGDPIDARLSMTPVELDEVNNLDTIIRLSMESYKSLMDDIVLIEPKNRVKHLELADKILNTAKDSMRIKESLLAQRPKSTVEAPPNEEEPSGTSRDELYEKRRAKLQGKS